MKIFAIGYSDNTSTSYLLNYLIEHSIVIDGVIFPKNQLKRGWRRLIKKIQLRGFISAIKRVAENLIVRKRQISKMLQQIDKVYFVDDINSEEVREILISNGVELLLLTATPIIKPIIIDIDGLTILNAHTGWLPNFRGLDANLKALRDKQQPGISVHKVTEKIDAGEIYLREHFQINYEKDILKQLDEEELKLAGKLLVEAVNLKRRNMLKPIATSEQLGRYEPPLATKEKKRIIQEIKKNRVNTLPSTGQDRQTSLT
jgi:methionyl-tRNA formyltransferase